MMKYVALLVALTVAGTTAGAQDSTSRVQPYELHAKPAWFAGRDAAHIGLGVLSVGVVSIADERVAKALQQSSARRNTALQHSANFIQVAGDPGALLISASLYAIGAATHHNGLADAGLHSTESIIASGAVTQLLKFSVGRERPNLTHDESAYAFHAFHGNHTDWNSFPSGHTTASFAAATAFSQEINRLHPRQAKLTTPLLYGIATLVGGARVYNDRHWLSDVVAGALIGHFVGGRITSHAHSQQ